MSNLEKEENDTEEGHFEPPKIKENVVKEEDHIEPPKMNLDDDKETSEVVKKKPSKPLRPENLEIAKRPKMIDISFVDVSDGHEDHPHLGALDANGVSGYIHDETALRINPPDFNYGETEMIAGCTKKDDNSRMMNKRIVVETEYDKKMNSSGQKRDKIFCLVYTIEQGHSKIPNIRETWG